MIGGTVERDFTEDLKIGLLEVRNKVIFDPSV
jgi:hypothetical protein